jgi:hypothetical protein
MEDVGSGECEQGVEANTTGGGRGGRERERERSERSHKEGESRGA